MTRSLIFSILATVTAVGTSGIGCNPHPIPTDMAHAQTASRTSSPDALALWKRTLKAQEQTPLRARAAVTISTPDADTEQQTIDVFEGESGRYRLVYRAPKSVAGRTVVCDGKQVYHYEPAHSTAIQRPRPPYHDSLMGPSEGLLAARYVSVLPDPVTIEGRQTKILEIRARNGGGLRERRWVDIQTGRSLRMEQYSVRGKRVRRVALEQIVLPFTATPDLFRPNFPQEVRIVAASAPRSPDAQTEAIRLKLPPRFGAFHARFVVRPRTGAGSTHQIIYSDGIYAISVFISPASSEGARPSGKGWNTVSLSGGVTGYSHDADDTGQSAIAFLRSGYRYVVVGRTSLPFLRRIVGELVSAETPSAR
jgi:outer membrane lipoprotein-sorting protein